MTDPTRLDRSTLESPLDGQTELDERVLAQGISQLERGRIQVATEAVIPEFATGVYEPGRIRVIGSTGSTELPRWLPPYIREAVLKQQLTDGITRFPQPAPLGDIVVWIRHSSGFYHFEIYQDFPEELEFYKRVVTKGDPRLVWKVLTDFNKKMQDKIERRGRTPDYARQEIYIESEERFKKVIEKFEKLLQVGAIVSQASLVSSSSAPGLIARAFYRSRVHEVLQNASIKVTQIAEVRIGNYVEPIFETSNGWVIGSYQALLKFKELNPKWLGFDAHHIIESRHLALLPNLKAGWLDAEMPAVLLPQNVHRAIYGELSAKLSEQLPNLNPGQKAIDFIFDAYEAVYTYVRNSDELLAIVKKMLGL